MTRSPPITAHLVRVLAVAAVVVGGVDRHHDLGLPVDLNRSLEIQHLAIVTLSTISTMSISPCVGHSCPFPVPSIQMAGQDPRRLPPSGLAGSVDLTWHSVHTVCSAVSAVTILMLHKQKYFI